MISPRSSQDSRKVSLSRTQGLTEREPILPFRVLRWKPGAQFQFSLIRCCVNHGFISIGRDSVKVRDMVR